MRDFPTLIARRAVATPRLETDDASAFTRLYERCAPRVMGFALYLTRDRSDAEDLTQETFLAAFSARSTFRGDAEPIAWLLGIARRRFRDKRRSQPPSSVALDDTFAQVPDPERPVDEIAARRLALQAALDRLPEPERLALVLTAVQGLTCAEAASVLDEPVGTIKWRVSMATRTLRTILGERDV